MVGFGARRRHFQRWVKGKLTTKAPRHEGNLNQGVSGKLSGRVIGMAIEVHREFGPVLLESVYEHCLCKELATAGVPFRRQVALPVVYEGERLPFGYQMDIVVEPRLIIGVKAVEHLMPVHEAQLLTYLRLSGYRAGLLINFNSALLKNGIRRMVL